MTSPATELLGLSSRWTAVWLRNFLVWRKLAGPAILGNLGEPLLYLLALGYGFGALVGEVHGLDYIVFLASGIVCASAMNTASFETMYSAYTRMAVQHTWEGILTAPLGIGDVALGEVVWAASKGLLSAAAILLVAALLGAVQGWAALWALPVVFLLGLAFASMAMVMTAVAMNYDFFLYYVTLVLTPMFLLSGVFFPLDAMPALIQQAAWVLPLTHGVAVVRPLMTELPLGAVWPHLLVVAAYALAAYALAVVLLRRRLLR
ncbi:ABC transporter permease [Ectothiorhodospiraceae bacterium 2226]|nr:ABC transporter permease [Ectothiorhodospiraceae bacterium 2226]